MAKFKLNDREYEVASDFTLGELADMEQVTGQGYDITQGGPAALLAILYVSIRRTDKSVTVDALRALSTTDLQQISDALEREDDEDDPPAVTPTVTDEPQQSSVTGSSNGSGDIPALTLAASGGQT